MSVVDAIGLIAGGLGIAGFFMSNYASGGGGASIQVKAGLECPDCAEFGGKFVAAEGYDTFNRILGGAGPATIGQGGVWNDNLQQGDPGIQADFLSLLADTDATCIAWITVKNGEDIEAASGAWSGDIGQACGQSWYAGNQIAGSFEDGTDWRPACSWLDADGTNGIPSASMKWAVNAYGPIGSAVTLDDGRQCDSTIFSPDNRLLRDEVPATGNAKRSTHEKRTMVGVARKPWMQTQLIVSDKYVNHNATYMCQHSMSYGPDFIGSDGYMCDMDKREVVPICSVHEVDGCVEVDSDAKTLNKRSNLSKRAEDVVHKSYKHITKWD